MINKTVRDIVIEWLNMHGYDGLRNEDCDCGIDDLFSCESCPDNCMPAEGSEWHGKADWIYMPEKEKADAKNINMKSEGKMARYKYYLSITVRLATGETGKIEHRNQTRYYGVIEDQKYVIIDKYYFINGEWHREDKIIEVIYDK
jgi:hypothetical protein